MQASGFSGDIMRILRLGVMVGAPMALAGPVKAVFRRMDALADGLGVVRPRLEKHRLHYGITIKSTALAAHARIHALHALILLGCISSSL